MRIRSCTIVLLTMLVMACAASDEAKLFEGDEPGECTDRADNDRDGDFDCDDEDCASGPDCSDTDRISDSASGSLTLDPAIEIGTGELDFEPLDDGDELMLIRGPQGGYHFLGSLRAKGIEPGDAADLANPGNPTVSFQASIDGVDLAPNAQYTQGLDPVEAYPWTHEMVGRLVILDIGQNPNDDDDLAGAEVVFSVTLEDVHGIVFTDARAAVIELHPFN